MSVPDKREDKLRMKCTQCNWMNDESEAVYGHRHCGKFCTCFCHVVAPHFNGTSAATHLREVIIEQAAEVRIHGEQSYFPRRPENLKSI